MRLFYFTALCAMFLLMSGCSTPSEIIRVGEPTVDQSGSEQEYTVEGHAVTKEITEESSVKDIKEITEQKARIDQPEFTLSEPPEIFFELYEPDNSVSVFQYHFWSKSDGTAILKNSDGDYFEIAKEQAEKLKEALENQ